MFSIVTTPIDSAAIISQVEDATAGAVVVFEGRVRNHHEGRQVRHLEYEAYQALAESEGGKIIAEALAAFPIHAAVCTHRTGLLEIGDIAVVVAVSSAHRGPAFDACRIIIDELKARVPIWKKETYADGSGSWVHCT
ncbi:MAG: molybdopterin-converting factor chain 2 [Akkermansiaceae bacterium]|nr:molybdopterin-converting factor chain 2 [Akkermansiaceae bacterium]